MIKTGQVVELSYVLKDAAGEELDSATREEPMTYLHGYGQIVPGLETALNGMKSGDKTSVTIPPAEAYGEINPQLQMRIHKSHFPEGQPLEAGMQFMAEMEGGHVPFTITNLESDHVHVDGNHPLAGETLHFDVEVVSIRDATQDEIAHGHAHGPDGHHH